MEYRQLPDLLEIDFHWSNEDHCGYYHENMEKVRITALNALIEAQRLGKKYVLFTHGSSTSRIGKTTARSQVRKLLRSKVSTPYVIRRECIEHYSVF